MERQVSDLDFYEMDGSKYVTWRNLADFEYNAEIGDYVRVVLNFRKYDRGKIIGIDESGFDIDVGAGLIFKKIRVVYADVIDIELL